MSDAEQLRVDASSPTANGTGGQGLSDSAMHQDTTATECDMEVAQADFKAEKKEDICSVSLPLEDGAKRRKLLQPVKYKPPLMLFNELYPGKSMEVELCPQAPQPEFKATVSMNSVEYSAIGPSKQKAKTAVASKVLSAMGIETYPSHTDAIAYPYKGQPKHFSNDIYEIAQQASGFSFDQGNYSKGPGQSIFRNRLPFPGARFPLPPSHITQQFRPFEQDPYSVPQSPICDSTHSPPKKIIDREKAANHPTMVMIETFPNLTLNWLHKNETAQRFFVEATVLGQTFFGEARSKRLAKANLAKAILGTYYGVQDFAEIQKTSKKATKHPLTQIRENFPEASFSITEQGIESKETEGDSMEVCDSDNVVKQEQSEEGDKVTDQQRKITASLTIDNQTFVGEGSSKMIAKTAAARKALSTFKRSVETGLKRQHSQEVQIDVTKHPRVMFNEIYSASKFELLDVTDDKDTMFGWKVIVNDVTYTERGPTKKKAKAKLAAKVFQELHGTDPNSWTEFRQKDKETTSVAGLVPNSNDIAVLQVGARPIPGKTVTGEKNLVSVLHELNPGLVCEFVEEPFPPNKVIFCAKITVKGEVFEGRGANKKQAKYLAAREALQKLHGIAPGDGYFGDPVSPFDQKAIFEDIQRDICDGIAHLLLLKEIEVLKVDEQCRVVAGFILGYKSLPGEYDHFEVISLGTGTKCVAGDKIGTEGTVVNDCHAEIVACRALRHYLYEQLEGITQGKESILEKSVTGRQQLKENYDLFLYISTAPCGDGRVFVTDAPTTTTKLPKTAGVLRTKVENGQGTIPVKEVLTQTTDGLIGGERLHTMSCSDKIMKWNVTGVQGALLSLFIDPIYLKGVVIGSNYHYSHLKRALNDRCTGLSDLPRPFKIQELLFGRTTNMDKRDTSKPSGNSCNWYKGKETSEVVVAATGKTVLGGVSCLGKAVFFKRFCELLRKSSSNAAPQTYHAAKEMATSFQSSKLKLYTALKEKKYGSWVCKPVENDMFAFN